VPWCSPPPGKGVEQQRVLARELFADRLKGSSVALINQWEAGALAHETLRTGGRAAAAALRAADIEVAPLQSQPPVVVEKKGSVRVDDADLGG
jgi:hypothetical protein